MVKNEYRFPFFVVFTLQLLVFVNASSNVPIDWYYGRTRDFVNARSLGLAGISTLISSPSGMFINPAVLGLIKKPSFELSANLTWTSEKRTKQLFDQFENTIGEILVADNVFTTVKPSPFAITYPLPTFGGSRVVIGIGYTSITDYYYYFYKELRDDYYQKIGDYEFKTIGQTQSINFATGVNLSELLNVGAGLYYSWGCHKSTQRIDSFKIKTLNFNFGTVTSFNERLKIGFDFQNRWQMQWDTVYTSNIVYYWNNSFGLGISYNFPGDIPTIALTEFRYIFWQKHSHLDYWSNCLNIRVGIEHTMPNEVRLRYGFGVIPSIIKLMPPTVLISMGIGFDVEPLRFDIGGNIQRRTLNKENFCWSIDEEKVYQTFGDIAISVSTGL